MNQIAESKPRSFPHALRSKINALIERQPSGIEKHSISGAGSVASLAALLAQLDFSDRKSHLVVLPSAEEVAAFCRWMRFFDASVPVFTLPSQDVTPYSGVLPLASRSSHKVGWLTNAVLEKKGLYVCDVKSFVEKTPPPDFIADHLHEITVGDELADTFLEDLCLSGYRTAELVEDIGTVSSRGGILDIFAPNLRLPVRIELFGDTVESIREFDPSNQRSLESVESLIIGPAREILVDSESSFNVIQKIKSYCESQSLDESATEEPIRALSRGNEFLGIENYLPFFFEETHSLTEHFTSDLTVWTFDSLELTRQLDLFRKELREGFAQVESGEFSPSPDLLFSLKEFDDLFTDFNQIDFSRVHLHREGVENTDAILSHRSTPLRSADLTLLPPAGESSPAAHKKLREWLDSHFLVAIYCATEAQKSRLQAVWQEDDFPIKNFDGGEDWSEEGFKQIQILSGSLPESTAFQEEKVVLIRAEDLLGRQRRARGSAAKDFQEKASALNFGELKAGDLVVHKEHGVGVYDGLEIMSVSGAESEFIKIQYKGGDKLFIPVYRIHQIQKYSGPGSSRILDKLGGNGWEKTKTKVRAKLRDVASELLELYVKRSQAERPAFSDGGLEYAQFEQRFPFEETKDQAKAIDDVFGDLTSQKPMDRLVCGDVGFGKTEVALRASFKAAQDGKQVAVLAPTTVLTYQHFENFKKRFKDLGFEIRALNRFLSRAQVRETLQDLKSGKINIVIGTHRLLSKDVSFSDLGLLIIDEEQKFGVLHKERIRKLKASVDTLTLSATPIPRTLNMSLMGLRDMSLITTPPVDRLPTRTFVCKYNPETLRKAIRSEIKRGGQIFFIHNRVQSIYGVCDELRELIPEARFAIGHGQMEEDELEKVVVDFYNHKIDVLVCTTIIESGIDIPKANTMFIDKANTFGLSQLYQLRGRVGRGKERAYCYLLLPRSGSIDKEAQERLKIIQENTALGSGIKIAHYDLELRGSGNLLGEDQSGNVNAVGYELYLELFEEALREAKGEAKKETVEPEINVRIPAFIPDKYIKDIRTRLAYYKTLSQIESPSDIDQIEDELRDLFGKPPEPVFNLLGLMLIRLLCKSLHIRDLSSGVSSITLAFTENTPLPAEKVVELTLQGNKKYSLTPDNRLKIRMKEIAWPKIYEELNQLHRYV